jgi:hypothetical protein
MSISWKCPKKLINRAYLENLRLFIQGQNLITVTKYKGLDPSTGSSNSLPPLRIITMGGQVAF